MSGTRFEQVSSTNKIQNILSGTDKQVDGTVRAAKGTNDFVLGLVTLTSLGVHALSFHPQITLLSAIAHITIAGIGSYWTVNGVVNMAEGSAEAAMGKEIREHALATPDIEKSSNIFLFQSMEKVNPPVDDMAAKQAVTPKV